MYDKELECMARLIVEDSLAIQPEEKVVILTDTEVDQFRGLPGLRDALLDIMKEKGIDAVVLTFLAREKGDAELPPLAEATCQNADVIICINSRVFLHSASFGRVFQYGGSSRMLVLPSGYTTGQSDYLYRTMPKTKEQFYEVGDTTARIGQYLRNGVHTVHLTSQNGTDLTFQMGTLRLAVHTGVAHKPGMAIQLPAGCINMGVNEGTANGTLVVDWATALENRVLDGKIVFDVKDGYAVSVSGGPEADKFVAAAEKNPGSKQELYNIAEFGLGFDKNAILDGRIGEGEYVYGAAHIAVGSNNGFGGHVFVPAWHVDCIIPRATVEIDGQLILKDGEYQV